MTVFVGPNLRWPNARIPYEVQGIQPHLHSGIQEINRCLGYHIFVDRLPADAAYMTVSNGRGNAQNIGYRGVHAHAITGGGEFTIIHEAMHVLGFLHEQYHRDYPWDDTVPRRAAAADFKTRDGLFSYARRIARSAWNTALYAELIKPAAYSTAFGADFQLDCRHAACTDPAVTHYLACDLSSVMMYPAARAAYQAARTVTAPPGGGGNIQATGNVGHHNILSTEDIAALRSIYPDPGLRCVKCGDAHGWLPSVINQWHRCPTCRAVYCPACGANLPGKTGMLNPYRNCDRVGCNGRTSFA